MILLYEITELLLCYSYRQIHTHTHTSTTLSSGSKFSHSHSNAHSYVINCNSCAFIETGYIFFPLRTIVCSVCSAQKLLQILVEHAPPADTLVYNNCKKKKKLQKKKYITTQMNQSHWCNRGMKKKLNFCFTFAIRCITNRKKKKNVTYLFGEDCWKLFFKVEQSIFFIMNGWFFCVVFCQRCSNWCYHQNETNSKKI